MKKRLYEAPTLERIEIQTEQGFAASPLSTWHDIEKGTSDISLSCDDDYEFGY